MIVGLEQEEKVKTVVLWDLSIIYMFRTCGEIEMKLLSMKYEFDIKYLHKMNIKVERDHLETCQTLGSNNR